MKSRNVIGGVILFVLAVAAPALAQSDVQWTFGVAGLFTAYTLDAFSPSGAALGTIGSQNPTIPLVIGRRYAVTTPPGHPFELIAKAASSLNDTILLSQKPLVTGSFESNPNDPNVAWLDTGTATVAFTLTPGLAAAMTNAGLGQIPGYRCGVHNSTMRGNITIIICGDTAHPFPVGDITKDCYVDLKDFALLAAHWLECTDPGGPCFFLPATGP